MDRQENVLAVNSSLETPKRKQPDNIRMKNCRMPYIDN